jgi:hypothetical protein
LALFASSNDAQPFGQPDAPIHGFYSADGSAARQLPGTLGVAIHPEAASHAMIPTVERSPLGYARTCGLLYLAIIFLGIYGEMVVRGSIVVSGDPSATADRLAASEFLWRSGIAGDLLMQVLDVPTIIIFYLLLRPVSESLALLSTAFNLVQTAVLALNKLSLLGPVLLLDGPEYLGVIPAPSLHVLSYLSIKAHGYGFAIGLVFFGFSCLVRRYLLYKSDYFPKVLGVLLQIAGVSYLLNSFALLLAPSFAQSISPGVLVPAFVGELFLSLWLLIKGVNAERWVQRVRS